MTREKNELGPAWNTDDDSRRVLRYCYDPEKLYGQLRNHSSLLTNVCPILFYDQDCKSMGKRYGDGVEYSGGITVSTV